MSKQTRLKLSATGSAFTIRLSTQDLKLLSELSKEHPLATSTKLVTYCAKVGLRVATGNPTAFNKLEAKP